MGNLFGTNDLPAALAYDPDSTAFSDAQKEALCEFTNGDYVNDISDALQRISSTITALTGRIQSHLARPASAYRTRNLHNVLGG